MMIEIKNQQKKIPIHPPRITKIIKKILAHEGITRSALSVAFVTDHKIKILNQEFLGHPYPTDVLAFDLTEKELSRSTPKRIRDIEGEIVISVATAARSAKRFRSTTERELILYIIHGILHLLGYDDHKHSHEKKMRAKEKELMLLVENF